MKHRWLQQRAQSRGFLGATLTVPRDAPRARRDGLAPSVPCPEPGTARPSSHPRLRRAASCQQQELYASKRFTASGCVQQHLSSPSSRLSFTPGTAAFPLPIVSCGIRGVFPTFPESSRSVGGQDQPPTPGRHHVPRYFIGTDCVVPPNFEQGFQAGVASPF